MQKFSWLSVIGTRRSNDGSPVETIIIFVLYLFKLFGATKVVISKYSLAGVFSTTTRGKATHATYYCGTKVMMIVDLKKNVSLVRSYLVTVAAPQ